MCLKKMQQVNLIDLKIIFSEDAKEWDKYLTDCLTEAIESASYQLQIVHERIENIQLNLTNDFSFGQQSIANLIIISPDFLNYVQNNFKLKLYFNNFKKENTICMLCGVKKSELTSQIKHNLVHFDNWKCLNAKDQDNNFIYNVIDSIRNILQKNSHHQDNEIYSTYSFISSIRCKKPMPVPNYSNEYKNLDTLNLNNEVIKKNKKISKFKISPRKVKTGNNKVFILLDEPLEDKYKPKVTLEYKTPSKVSQKFKQELEEVQVIKKNPYTLQFVVPGNLLNSSKVISVNLYTELGNETKQFGNRLLKCEYEKNDFLEVIQKFSDCISYLKQSLRLDTLEELDLELSRRFKNSLPIDDFNKFFNENQLNEKLTETNLIENNLKNDSNDWSINKKNNSTKFPTLLHFAANYNLKELASSLLKCNFFLNSTSIKNCDGLTPLGIADFNKNENISNIIKNSLYKNNSTNKNDELNYVNMASLNFNKLDLLNDFDSNSSNHSSNENINKYSFNIDCNEQNMKNKKEEEIGNLIDLNDTSNDDDYLNSSEDENKLNENNYSNSTSPLKYEMKKENNDYDIVKTSPRRANILNTKTILLDRFDELRLSSDSFKSEEKKIKQDEDNLILASNLQTSNLTESQIELMNIINAFKMGVYTNDEMEKKFKLWAVKYKYKIDNEKKKNESSSITLGKRSVSSSHLLSQDSNLNLKENENSKTNTIKTCLSNLNLNNVSSPTKLSNKQFSITEWFHFLTSKLKQKNETLLQHKSPKFEKKEKITSPSKISSVWSKKLSSSNVLAVRKSLLTPKEFEKLKSSPETLNDKLIDVKDAKVKSLTLPLRAVNTNKSISPVKIKKKLNLNIKKNSKSNLTNIETIEKPKLFENLNNNFNIIDKNKLNIMPVLSNEWNSFKLDENNKIILNSIESTKNNLNINEYNEYDRIPLGPPIPAKPLSCNQY